MITLILSFFARLSLFSRIKSAITYTIERWRVFLPLLILALIWHYYNAQVKRADKAIADKIVAEKALIEHVTADSLLAEKTIAENKLKEDKARKDLSIAEITAHNQLDVILDKDKTILQLTKDLKANYAQKTINYNLSHSGIVLHAESSLNSESETATNSSASAESESECDAAAYNTLERACTIETIHYNLLREWADIACNQVGCN